jgi:hypothetical protein
MLNNKRGFGCKVKNLILGVSASFCTLCFENNVDCSKDMGDKCFQVKSLNDNVKMAFFGLEHEIL